MADIGCGIGYFSIPGARIVGEQGRVVALDASEPMLAELRRRTKNQGLSNIEVIHSDPSLPALNPGSIGFALLSNVLHEIDDRKSYIIYVFEALQILGRIAVIEWKRKVSAHGPPLSHRLAPEDVQTLLLEAGFSDTRKEELNEDLYAVTGRRGSGL